MEDGGPAFPSYQESAGGQWSHSQTGMTLRDYFAGQALQGLIEWYGQAFGDRARIEEAINTFPEAAYKLADAMLRARGK